jgi:hypothetical protein
MATVPNPVSPVKHEVEVWVLVDADGNAVASTDPDQLADLYDEQVSADAGTPRRRVRVVLTVEVADVVLRGTIPAEPEGALSALGGGA